MAVKHPMQRDEAIALLQTLAAQNDGYLSTNDYIRLARTARPQHNTLEKILGVSTWAEACKVAGIGRTLFDTWPEVLELSHIKYLLANNTAGGEAPPLEFRQQAARYCLRQVGAELKRRKFTSDEYDAVAVPQGLYTARIIRLTIGSWNEGLRSVGFETSFSGGNKSQKGKEERESQMMIETLANKWPANWRTLDVGLATLEPVTTVTLYVMANGLGLRHSEVRAVIR
jgi:hypothetical protein